MALLDDVKEVLKANSDSNIEVLDLIEAAKMDLIISGVLAEKVVDTDFLIKRAINLYCKANYSYEDPKIAERFEQQYISLKQHLTLSIDYTVGEVQ